MLTGTNVNLAKVVYIFKNAENEIEATYEVASGCPFRTSCMTRPTELAYRETFDLVLNDKVLSCNFDSPCLIFYYKSLEWKLVMKNISPCNEYHNPNGQMFSKPHLANFYSETKEVERSFVDNPRLRHMNLYARYLNFESKDSNIQNSPSWCLFSIEVPLQLRYLVDYRMLRCGPRGVIFLGGEYIIPKRLGMLFSSEVVVPTDCNDGSFSNKILWHGELSNDGYNMSWKAVRLGVFGVKLIQTMCFKLKNDIYILDSWHVRDGECLSCGKYDLRERQYHRNVFELPFTDFPEIFNEPKIMTDANETFAIFVVRVICYHQYTSIQEKLWIFTEDEGFRSLCDLETASILSLNNGNLIRLQ